MKKNPLIQNAPAGLLKGELKRPMDRSLMANDELAAKILCAQINDKAIPEAERPLDAAVSINHTAAPTSNLEQEFAQPPPNLVLEPKQPQPPVPKVRDMRRVFFTGRVGVGKDYIAEQMGAKVFGFADPLYALASQFFGVRVTATEGKDLPGVRKFLQDASNWGRGDINAQYPLTAERAVFIQMIRSLAAAGLLPADMMVDWAKFGTDSALWARALAARVQNFSTTNPGVQVVVTNVRFKEEFEILRNAGWSHTHIMCSAKSWTERLAKRGLNPQSPTLRDMSEAMAAGLDADVTKRISQQRTGGMLHCVWNDSVPSPSQRLFTLAQFLQHAAILNT